LLVPAKTPPSIVQRLHDETVRILTSPEIVQSYASSGTQAVGSSPEEFAAFIKAEQMKWAKVITETGIKSE